MKKRRVYLAGGALVAALQLTAITGVLPGSAAAKRLGKATAAAGTGIHVKHVTIGVMDIDLSTSPISRNSMQAIQDGCKALGWTCLQADGQGNPQTEAAAVSAFATKHVSAVLLGSVEPSAVAVGLHQLAAEHVPVIGYNAQVTPSPLLAEQYTENEYTLAQKLAQYVVSTVHNAHIGDITSTLGISGTHRNAALLATVKGRGANGAKIDQTIEPDLTNIVPSTTQELGDMLTAHPDINTVWSVYDNFLQPALAALRSRHSSAKLYTFYLDPTSYGLLKQQNSLQAVLNVDLGKTGMVALDQLVRHFQTGAKLDPSAMKENPLTYTVITRKNLPSSLAAAESPAKVAAPFIAKWKKMYH